MPAMGLRQNHLSGLDGLRALAVASVVAYHLNYGWARGGYLGVDLFFVLSGFLITTLLLEEHLSTGRIALLSFWGRRARRLLPALYLVVAVVVAFPWLMTACVLSRNLEASSAKKSVAAVTAVIFAYAAVPNRDRHRWRQSPAANAASVAYGTGQPPAVEAAARPAASGTVTS